MERNGRALEDWVGVGRPGVLDLDLAIGLVSWAPQLGGSGRYALELIKALLPLRGSGTITLLCNGHAMERLLARPELTLRRVPFSSGRNPLTRGLFTAGAALFPKAAVPKLLGRRCDLLHYPLTVPFPRFKGPTVVTLRDIQHHALPEQWWPHGMLWRRFAYDRAAREATVVITVSNFSKSRMCGTLGLDEDRVVVAPLAVDHNAYTPYADPWDKEVANLLSLPEDYVLYPAGFWPHKNHLPLVEAFALLEMPTVHLLFTGTRTPRLRKVLALARRLGVGDRVRYLGFLPDYYLPSLYRRALAVVFPSLYEGFGLPPLEAMACGTPVASSRRAALDEVIGDAALPLQPEDPEQMAETMTRLLGERLLRRRLIRAGIQRARTFTWERTALDHLLAYHMALELGG
jgi:glycosyltransferase involved in cell wall biosynthesis